MVLEKLEPAIVWQLFESIFTTTPRESKKESKIRDKIKTWIKKINLNISEISKNQIIQKNPNSLKEMQFLQYFEDSIGNILIKKRATAGMEHHHPILFQGHLDMVCETDLPEGYDFETQPIIPLIQANREWVEAKHTTLGADNGIGVSMSLALLIDPDPQFTHGPLEILLTVDEETGLTGAFNLDPIKIPIKSHLLVNIDSEDYKIITIGSAGGGDSILTKNIQYSKDIDLTELAFFQLSVSGLLGGHSGVDIHLPRANAIKISTKIISRIMQKMEIYLASWNGGSKRNAIPRNSILQFAINKSDLNFLNTLISEEKIAIYDYFHQFETQIQIEFDAIDPCSLLTLSTTRSIINLLALIPNGVQQFSYTIPNLVETSNNLAIISTTTDQIKVQISSRSNIDQELNDVRYKLKQIANLLNWKIDQPPSYPGWTPNLHEPFLQYVKEKYDNIVKQDNLAHQVHLEAIHAGLECSLIGAKFPGMQMVSIGPSIQNPHTPHERVNIRSVQKLYKILKLICNDIHEFQQ